MERDIEGQAEGQARQYEGQAGYDVPTREVSGWAVGFITFAAMLLVIIGVFHIFTGLVAIIDDTFFETPREYFTDFSAESWGWIHLVAGIIVVLVGFGLLTGNILARIVAVVIAFASAIVNFAFIPYYPVWSILMIALAIGVMWAVIAHGRDVAEF